MAKRLQVLMYENIVVVYFIASVICAAVRILAYHMGVVEAFLGSFLIISVGVWGIAAFVVALRWVVIGHILLGHETYKKGE